MYVSQILTHWTLRLQKRNYNKEGNAQNTDRCESTTFIWAGLARQRLWRIVSAGLLNRVTGGGTQHSLCKRCSRYPAVDWAGMLCTVRTTHTLTQIRTKPDFRWTLGGALARGTHLDVSVQSAGTLGTVRDPVGLLVDGSQTRRWRGGVLSVTLDPREQDAAEGGLGGRMQHQLRGKA